MQDRWKVKQVFVEFLRLSALSINPQRGPSYNTEREGELVRPWNDTCAGFELNKRHHFSS